MTRILDENGRELQENEVDLDKGYLEDDTITVHHPAEEAVEEQSHIEVLAVYYEKDENGDDLVDASGNKVEKGRDVQTVVDVPGHPAHDAYDEVEDIRRYRRFSKEQLDQIAKDKAAASVKNVKAAQQANLNDLTAKLLVRSMAPSDILSVTSFIPEFDPTASYAAKDVVTYSSVPYQAVQKVPANSGQTPDKATSLWRRVGNPDAHGVYPWVQPLGAEDAYNSGDTVTYKDQTWVSDIDHNVWAPDVSGWSVKGAQAASDDSWPEWKQPESTNPYSNGAKVSHNGKHWVSITDGNVWEPGVYGWNNA